MCRHGCEDSRNLQTRRVSQKQRLIDGRSICSIAPRFHDCDSAIALNMVEEHIYLKQEVARERIRKSRDKTASQSTFLDLNLSVVTDPGCENQFVLNDASIGTKPQT